MYSLNLQGFAWYMQKQIDPQRSVRADLQRSLKTPAIWSATISFNLQRFAHTLAKCYTSEGEASNPGDHPASCHMRFGGNPLTVVRHKPTASISSILTLPKLHLATFRIIDLIGWWVRCCAKVAKGVTPNALLCGGCHFLGEPVEGFPIHQHTYSWNIMYTSQSVSVTQSTSRILTKQS